MGRPIKQGLDYFPLDVVLDTKLKLIKAEFGILGFGIVIRLFQYIYGENGYYMEWSQDVALMFSSSEQVGVNVVSEVINACLKRGIFDQGKFKEFGILTSKGIQERYLEVASRRIGQKICDEYAVLNAPKKTVNTDINGINVHKNEVNESRKCIKESKVNKSKNTTTAQKSLIEFAEEIFGRPINSAEMEKIIEMQKAYADDLIILALKETALNNVQHINYTAAILASWKAQGFDTVEKAQVGIEQRRTKVNSKGRSKRQDVLPDYYVQMKNGSDLENTEDADFDRNEFEEIRRKLKEQEQ
ncbi:MAG: Lin1244/Lin1753 domain-containing protein [[Clostridium] innocuum]